MIALRFNFPAGCYHATPWGRSVNEADVAWPPEPWRILRALVATWHRKWMTDELILRNLIDALASELPRFVLPEGVHTHTRHYMPVNEGRKVAKRLIFDAFIRLPKDSSLIVSWPCVSLAAKESELLHNLAPLIGYLGRAESWVKVVPLTELDDAVGYNCLPIDEQKTGGDQGNLVVSVLAPLTANVYAEQLLALRESTANIKEEIVKRTLGNRLIDALSNETADIQAAGWRIPPGSQRVLYRRRELRPIASRSRSSRTFDIKPTTARFILAGRPRPRVEDSMRIGELMRYALMSKSRDDEGDVASVFVGRDCDGRPRQTDSHTHAFFLPEDADDDGLIDYVLVHAEDGFDSQARRALNHLSRIYKRDGSKEWRVALEWIGAFSDFADTGRLACSSCEWVSATPYLMPWHAKKKFGPEEQVRRECDRRGYPAVESVETLDFIKIGGRQLRSVQFHRFRSRRGLVQPDRLGQFLHITFAEPPVRPVALGFGCHFGLGLFHACESKRC